LFECAILTGLRLSIIEGVLKQRKIEVEKRLREEENEGLARPLKSSCAEETFEVKKRLRREHERK
jgi:hypothetical protein